MNNEALAFDTEDFLSPGTHQLSIDQFLNQFCSSTDCSRDYASRSRFYKPFMDICEWAEETGATSLVIGGSFVSKKVNPSDIDMLIFYSEASEIPKSLESFYVDGVKLDIQLLSEDQPMITDAFLQLLATE